MPIWTYILVFFLSIWQNQMPNGTLDQEKRDGGNASRLEFSISPECTTTELGKEISLQCTIKNKKHKPFRILRAWEFTREEEVSGTLTAEILLGNQPYLDWKEWIHDGHPPKWTEDHVITLQKGESHTFDAKLTSTYPLYQKGTYTLRATFEPAELDGVKVSKCRPVKSNWVTIVVR